MPKRVWIICAGMCVLLLGCFALIQSRATRTNSKKISSEETQMSSASKADTGAATTKSSTVPTESDIPADAVTPNTLGWTFPFQAKPNSEDPTKTEVFRLDTKTHQQQLVATLPDICRDPLMGRQHQNGDLYVVRTMGEKTRVNVKGECNGWGDDSRRELWKYDSSGKGMRLASNVGSFEVSADGKTLAISEIPEPRDVTVMSADGTILKVLTFEDLKLDSPEVLAVTADSFWLNEEVGGALGVLVKVKLPDLEINRIDMSALGAGAEYEFEPAGNKIVFSSYPDLYEVDSEEEYKKSKSEVILAVYDFQSQKMTELANSVTKRFNPKWIGKNTVQYDDPDSPGRIAKVVH